MNFAVIGSGGREHSICFKLKQSPKIKRLICIPGNAGTREIAENINININNFEEILAVVKKLEIDVVIVGPEDPLVNGLHDYLISEVKDQKFIVIGPKKSGAILEGSKKFAKAILESWNSGITFSDIVLSNENVKNNRKLSQYRAHLISSGSSHALINHNRRFYYDPINESLLPIYYDGDSNIRNLKKLIFEK